MQNLQKKNAVGSDGEVGSLLLGTGLTLASLILVPALSQAVGLGPSLTSAVRVVLMKAAARV